MADRLFIPRKLWVDLTEFGFGIREVRVLSGGGGGDITPGVPIPHDTVDSDSIIDGSVQMVDLADEVKDEMLTDDDRVTQDELNGFDV